MPAGFATGKWEGDTLTARSTHLKTAWIRRGVGIPASDETIITLHMTRRDDLLTMTTIQEDPYYLTEPHVVSRVWQWNPRGTEFDRPTCNTGNEIPSLEDTGGVPHYLPGQNPEEDYMVRMFNIPKEAAMGYAQTLYPEYRKTLKGMYKPPADCSIARAWLLLRLDRDAGTAGRRAQPDLQRRRLRRPRTARTPPRSDELEATPPSACDGGVSTPLRGSARPPRGVRFQPSSLRFVPWRPSPRPLRCSRSPTLRETPAAAGSATLAGPARPGQAMRKHTLHPHAASRCSCCGAARA